MVDLRTTFVGGCCWIVGYPTLIVQEEKWTGAGEAEVFLEGDRCLVPGEKEIRGGQCGGTHGPVLSDFIFRGYFRVSPQVV